MAEKGPYLIYSIVALLFVASSLFGLRQPVGNEHIIVSTANGPARATKGWADRLEVGSIERTDFPVDINENHDVNLLGMNFLSSLQSWRVEGNYLVLQP